MVRIIKLIQNENMKIYYRTGTWAMLGILVLTLFLLAVFIIFMWNDDNSVSWQEQLLTENEAISKLLSERRLPGSVLEKYKEELHMNNYRLEQNIPPVKTKSFWGYITSVVKLVPFITVFTIVIAAGVVANEFSLGTMKLLLIRPVSRSKILLSKYVATLIFGLLLLTLLVLVSVIIGIVFFGTSSLSQPQLMYQGNEIIEKNMFLHLLTLYGLSSIDLLMMMTFAFMISIIFRNSSLAIGLTIFFMFTGPQIVHVLKHYDWVKYLFFANTSFIQYVEKGPIIEGMTISFSIFVLIFYFCLFNGLSWFVFQIRDVTN